MALKDYIEQNSKPVKVQQMQLLNPDFSNQSDLPSLQLNNQSSRQDKIDLVPS